MEDEDVTLEDCPFCNHGAHMYKEDRGMDGMEEVWVISCLLCPAQMAGTRNESKDTQHIWPDEREDIIKRWNTRA